MNWVLRLTFLGGIIVLILYAFAETWYLRATFAVAIALLLTYYAGEATQPSQRLREQQQEIERLSQVCEELDQNTRLIVQTDLELTRTQEELDKKISGLYTLHELSQKLIAIQTIPSLLTLITEALVTKLGFEKAIAFLGDPATGMIEAESALGYSQDEAAKFEWATLLALLKPVVFEQGRPALAATIKEAGEPLRQLGTLCGVTSVAVTPIILKDRPAGGILVGSNPPYEPVEQGDLDLLTTLASEAAVAIDNVRLYDEIRRSHQELEQRVRERTAALAKANEELKRLNKMKSDFVSAVSHELRTP